MGEGVSGYPQLNDREWLYWKYFVERLTIPEIAKIVGCGRNTVDYHIKRHSLPKRKRIRRNEHNQKIGASGKNTKRERTKYPELYDKKWLIEKYYKENMTAKEVSEIVGCCGGNVLRALRILKIPRKPANLYKPENNPMKRLDVRQQSRTHHQLWDKEWMEQKYINEELSATDIAAIVGCDKSSINWALHSLGIPVRSVVEAKSTPRCIKKTTDSLNRPEVKSIVRQYPIMWVAGWLEGKYVREKLSASDIADIVGCSKPLVYRTMRVLGIPRRSGVDAIGTPRAIQKIRSGIHAKPNKLEKYVNSILQTHFPNEWAYNGNYSCGVSLAGLVPDFVNVNGQKAVIEVYGDIYHDAKKMRDIFDRNLSWKRTEFGRKAIFAQLGYKTVILWGSKIKEEGESYILEEIKRVI